MEIYDEKKKILCRRKKYWREKDANMNGEGGVRKAKNEKREALKPHLELLNVRIFISRLISENHVSISNILSRLIFKVKNSWKAFSQKIVIINYHPNGLKTFSC